MSRRTSAAEPGGGVSIDLKPLDRRAHGSCRPTRSSRNCGRSWRRCPACASYCVNQPPINIGGAAGRAQPVPVHAAGHATPRSSTSAAHGPRSRRCTTAGDRGRQQRPADHRTRRVNVADGPRARSPRSGLTADQVETALFNAYGTRQVSTDLRAEQRVPGDPAGRARVPDGPGLALSLLYVPVGDADTARAARAPSPRRDRTPARRA